MHFIQGIPVLKIVIWGGKSSVLWSEISVKGAVNAVCDNKTDDLSPQMTILITFIPNLMHFLTFSSLKVYYFAPKAVAFSNVKP